MLRAMLARLILLLVALPSLALAAPLGDTLPNEGPVFVPPPKPAKALLDTASAVPPPSALLSRAPPPPDPAACRQTCSQSYYMCSAADQHEPCGDDWGQCVSACDTPRLDPNAAPSP